ncbi:MAG TPA: metallophosphoesterase [Anaerolineaceae bacterium]
MKILAVSDVEVSFIYSPSIIQRFADVDLIIGCGDLPYFYLEYIVSMLNKPMYFVLGNHMNKVESGVGGDRRAPWGAVHLHRRILRGPGGLLLAGMDGSLLYNFGPKQYSQEAMWRMVLLMAPGLLLNKMRYGRYLDIFVSHAPPRHVQDREDLPHQGFTAFRWLLRVFQPAIHLHGHIHLYRPDAVSETLFEKTRVINAYAFREIDFPVPMTGLTGSAEEVRHE